MKAGRIMELLFSGALLIGILAFGFYLLIYQPYFQLTREDARFFENTPTKSEVMQRFRHVDEELGPGESFQMTGWYPLPDRKVTGSAFSVTRLYGKIYLFFDSSGRLEEFFVTTS